MYHYLFVAVGAACGGVLRYWLSMVIQRHAPFGVPLGTLSVNIIGSFILGFIIFNFDARELISTELKLLLTVGVCGGFTTFSTFSYETISLLKDSEYLLAFLNVGLNLFLALFAVVAAYYVVKVIH